MDGMSLETAGNLLDFLLECKEGKMAEYLDANEEAFREAIKIAAGCIKKELEL